MLDKVAELHALDDLLRDLDEWRAQLAADEEEVEAALANRRAFAVAWALAPKFTAIQTALDAIYALHNRRRVALHSRAALDDVAEVEALRKYIQRLEQLMLDYIRALRDFNDVAAELDP